MDDAQKNPGSGPADPAGIPAVPMPPAPSGVHPGSGVSAPPPGPGPKPQEPASAVPAAQGTGTGATEVASPGGGRTAIAEQAVAKVAAIAARSVPGVHALGTGGARTLGAVRDAVAGSDSSATAGVHVEVGETEAAVDVTLVADYGQPLTGIADAVRTAVYAAVEDLVGLNVVEVNVSIADVHLPESLENRGTKRPAGSPSAE